MSLQNKNERLAYFGSNEVGFFSGHRNHLMIRNSLFNVLLKRKQEVKKIEFFCNTLLPRFIDVKNITLFRKVVV